MEENAPLKEAHIIEGESQSEEEGVLTKLE